MDVMQPAADVLQTEPITMIQFARIANQLHRVILASTEEAENCATPNATISQLSTMGFLFFSEEEGREVYQKDIEHIFRLRRSTVSSLLRALENKGLIQRVSVPQDARLKKLVLTDKARQINAHTTRTLWKVNEVIHRGLSQEEIQTLHHILNKIETNLQEEPQ